MKFIDFFAGIGGFRRGMELAGHECAGFCEWDKYAAASYISMHLITEDQRRYLSTLSLKQRQKEILKDEYRNGEWYADDIRNVDARSVPRAGCWCFGAPCQDFSIAGKRAGLAGDRSSLVCEVFRLLGEMREEDRPEWIIYENVKGMLSSNRGFDFLAILLEMDGLGYDIEWQLINSKDFGVPQNRERVYTVGHLGRYGPRKVFPVTGADGENRGGITDAPSTAAGGGRGHNVALPCFVDMNYGAGIKHTENARSLQSRYNKGVCGRNRETSGVAIPVLTPDRANKRQNGRRFKENGEPMFTLTAQDRHGVAVKVDGTCRTLKNQYQKNSMANFLSRTDRGATGACLKIYDMHNHAVKDDGICGTLTTNGNKSTTACGAFGVMVPVREATKQGFSIAQEGDAVDLKSYCSKTRRGTVKGQTAGALDHDCNQGIVVRVMDDLSVYAIWYEEYQCYIAIRRLTPRECFRLQGWEDIYFDRAAFVNSDSQLYMQAGNGVTVNVVYEIGKKIQKIEGRMESCLKI